MLKFHPEPSTILICDYGNYAVEPEMVKRRPVVVISPRLKHRTALCAVVALSTTPPDSIQDYHCTIAINPPLPRPFDSPETWVKADMISTVGFHRLDLPRTGRDQYGKRRYLNVHVSANELRAIYRAVLCGLGMGRLTPHL
ncbi:MAG: type II toxin-antitoxin system PemK/MazF family toxin [Propylenella sp.]